MKQYLDLINLILEKGELKENRTGIDTLSYFGAQMRFNLTEGFPLLTTKKIHFKSIVHELLWFIKGDTNIKYLVDNNVRIWNEWPYDRYRKSPEFKGENIKEFVQKIKDNKEFALKYADLGPVYGKQWRNFLGVDQLKNIIEQIKNNKNSRRLIVSAWNPIEVDEMALPPCHVLFQFYVHNNKISLQLYQRSADVFLGVPFNIASYSLLLMLVAKETNLIPYEFIHTIGDAHIYINHQDQILKQLKRIPKQLPTLLIKDTFSNIFETKYEDIELINYDPYPLIKGEVAV